MLALVFAAVMFWAASIIDDVRSQHERLAEIYQSRAKQHDMIRVAEGIELYYRENNVLPTTLNVLATTPGFEHLSTALNAWQGYGVSASLSDGTWTFQRAVAFTNDPSKGTTVAAYLAANQCGTGGYNTSVGSWCGTKDSMWFVKDTRQQLNDQIVTERVRLNRLTQKFADYRNTNNTYPDKDSANVALSAGSITAIASLVGYSGTAKACTGQYQYKGIPIDCGDMFDSWGGKIGYQFESSSHIILVSEPPIFDGSGARVVIAADRA